MTPPSTSGATAPEISAMLKEQVVLMAELDRRRRTDILTRYRPYAKQREFHAAGTSYRERLFMAGNQLGKTLAGAAEAAMHLTGRYPDWWQGRRFDKPIVMLAGSESYELTRDGVQRLLVGPPLNEEDWGTGFIPRAAIQATTRRSGASGALDSVTVRHASGGTSTLLFKAYEQGRGKWQANTVDYVWFDEEPPEDVYFEGITRTNATRGSIALTFTPLKGLSSVVARYLMEKSPDREVITMTIEDAEHYSPEERRRIIDSYPAHEREARTKGVPRLGSGRIFPVTEETIRVDPFDIPKHWVQIGGLDFGWDHPFAAAGCAWDRDADVFYVTRIYREREATPIIHAAALKPWGAWLPFAWPHDGLQHDKGSGEQLAAQYRAQGLPLLAERATFDDGTNGVEAGLSDMLQRMQTGRWKVFSTCAEWFEEFRLYHRQGRQDRQGARRPDLRLALRADDEAIRESQQRQCKLEFHRPKGSLMAAMTDERLCALVSQLVKDCENYRDELAIDRIKAMEYYDGTMKDVPADANRSKVVSRDVRAAIKKVLPSLIRTILGNDKVVEYAPVNEGDEAAAEQASDYINYVVFPESDGYDAVQDAAHDALKLRNGVIRWWYEKQTSVAVSTHTGLDEAALIQLVGDDAVEVLEQSRTTERIETPQGVVEQPSYSVKIRRRLERGTPRLAAVPLEEFLIHPEAISIADSPITGIATRMRRSDLVAMGYDRDLIEGLPASTGDSRRDDEEFARRRDAFEAKDAVPKALEEVDYYELYVKVDADDDGIAELRRLVLAGGTGEEHLLSNEEWDEVPFADLIIERRPHQREGGSVTDDMAEIQRVKTVLMRQTLDNLYWQNNQQPIVQEGAIANPEAVLNPKFGQPIRVSQGIDARAALGYTMVPFVAKESFAMLSYLDQEATDRTGISDASSGLAPDALTNMTARATALIEQAGIGQTELMVRTFAQGLRRVFKGLLRLVIKHQDRPRAVRLRGLWVTFDPRHWNAEMDATVNTGLGAGTRERDMMMMQMIQQLQEKLLMTLGPDNPYVSPDNLYNGIAKSVEAAGLKSPDLYFTKPTPEEIQRRMQASASQPNAEMQKLEMRAQADAEKARLVAENDRRRLEIERELKLAEIQQKGALRRYQIDAELDLKRQQSMAEAVSGESVTAVHIGGLSG